MLLAWLADKLVLKPSQHVIDPEHRVIHKVAAAGEKLEILECFRSDAGSAPGLVALKFSGTGGRAERAGPHPLELVQQKPTVVYSVNMAGYGGSSGRATLQTLPQQCEAVFSWIKEQNPGKSILLTGNSLGCISALYLAARYEIAGIYLKNPPALAQLIGERSRYNWWSFGMAKQVAAVIPDELDSIANASSCNAPAFFLQSELDSVVPVEFQDRIIDAYAGDTEKFVIPGAGHGAMVPKELEEEYVARMRSFLVKVAG